MATDHTVENFITFLGNSLKQVIGSPRRIVETPAALDDATNSKCISFCKAKSKDAIEMIQASRAGTIVCCNFDGLDAVSLPDKTLIVVDNPRLSFMKILETFFAPERPSGIHPTAVVDASARIHDNAYIGPFCIVDKNCTVGEDTIIYGNAHLYSNTQIGRNVIIHSGVVIGADGFGFEKTEDGRLNKFLHYGGVIVEDDVEVGANTCIDRGTLSSTIIGRGTKIDNLVQIGHNVEIGENCAVIGLSVFSGGVKAHRGAWIAPGSSVREKIVLGENSTVGLGGVVVKHVEPGTTVYGNPARTGRVKKDE